MPASNRVAMTRDLFVAVRGGLRPDLRARFWEDVERGVPIPPPPLFRGTRLIDLGDEPDVCTRCADFGSWVVRPAQLEADITKLPFADHTFDVTLLHHVVERCSPAGALEVLREAARITSGRLVIGLTTPLRFDGKLVANMEGATYLNQYPLEMFKDTLRPLGFGLPLYWGCKLSDDGIVIADREAACSA